MLRQLQLIFILILIYFTSVILGYYGNSTGLSEFEDIMMRKQLLTDLDEMKDLLKSLNQRCEENQETKDILTKEMPIFDARYDVVPEKCQRNYTAKNCDEATSCIRRNGIYDIRLESYSGDPFLVECDAKIENGGWIVIQRRQDGSENFYRDWNDFKWGFGSLQGEFWIGLDKLYALTNYMGSQELMVFMEDEGVQKFARYSNFVIGNETEYYVLKSLGKYSGTAGDSLRAQLGMKFTTKDRDNDEDTTSNCAQKFMGAWWHKACHASNLNGKYGDNDFGRGVNWYSFKNYTRSIQYVKMMIRRRRE